MFIRHKVFRFFGDSIYDANEDFPGKMSDVNPNEMTNEKDFWRGMENKNKSLMLDVVV
jgi:hypothetical protein